MQRSDSVVNHSRRAQLGRALTAAGAALALLACGAVHAQNAPAAQGADQTTTPASGGDQLQEVIVTAQFRNQSAQQTPLAITAISADELANRGQTSITEISNDAPSVNLAPAETAFGPSMVAFIRGIGQYDFDPALEPGVGIYVDDVYYGTLTGSLLDLLDLERVEVLRGPQGTLSGMNSEGGAIKLFSKVPDANAETTIDALYGSRNHAEIRANSDFVLVPDHVFVRFAGVGNHQDGYENVYDYGCANPSIAATATNGVTGTYSVGPSFLTHAGSCLVGQEGGTNYTAGRVSVRWLASDNLEATFIGDITDENQENGATSLLYANNDASTLSATNTVTGAAAQLPFDSSKVPSIIPSNPYTNYSNFCLPAAVNEPGQPGYAPGPWGNYSTPAYCGQDRTQLMSWGASANILWTINGTTSLRSITAQRGYSTSWFEDNDSSAWNLGLGGENLEHHQTSEELRLTGSWGSILDYTIGGFYFRELSVYGTHQDLDYVGAEEGFPVGAFDFLGQDPILAHDKAGFIHTDWHLTKALDLILGGRYTSQDKSYTYTRESPTGVSVGPSTAFAVASLNGVVGNYSASRVDYRADLDYHWTQAIMTYAEVSTGFKGGGVNPRPFNPAQALHFNPETLTNYEIGLKSTWFDNHLRANLDAYFGQYRDVQLALLNCSGVEGIPAGDGIPCALPFNAGDAHQKGVEFETEAHLGGLQLDGSLSYLNFKFSSLYPGTGVTSSMVPPFTPEWSGNMGAQYTVPVGAAGALTARVEANTRSEVWTESPNAPTNRIGGYTTFNAHVSWDNTAQNWQIMVQALNFTDKRYMVNIFDLTGAGAGSVVGSPSPPLEVDLEIKHTMK
ncbi:MAG: TonB-dependent receptor [Steroidobacteraceae bacterium]